MKDGQEVGLTARVGASVMSRHENRSLPEARGFMPFMTGGHAWTVLRRLPFFEEIHDQSRDALRLIEHYKM